MYVATKFSRAENFEVKLSVGLHASKPGPAHAMHGPGMAMEARSKPGPRTMVHGPWSMDQAPRSKVHTVAGGHTHTPACGGRITIRVKMPRISYYMY